MGNTNENKSKNGFMKTLIVAAVCSAISSLATYQITKNYVGNKPDIVGSWYSTYAGQVFSLTLKNDDTCEFGYDDQEKTKCTYDYSDEVLRLKSDNGIDELVYSLDETVLYISSQPYYSTKEESSDNDEYFAVPDDYDISMFSSLTIEEFIKKFNAGDTMFVLSARGSCGFCQQFRPIAADSVKKYDYTLYYLDSAKVTSDQFAAVQALDSKLEETYSSTPNVYYIKDKKVVAISEGAVDFETFEKFLTDNGVKAKPAAPTPSN
ncbi:MAG: hypothetical protein IJB71_02520 [Bacilli bacterium]|nr:hypothetical protein [Bacilli bacterium]